MKRDWSGRNRKIKMDRRRFSNALRLSLSLYTARSRALYSSVEEEEKKRSRPIIWRAIGECNKCFEYCYKRAITFLRHSIFSRQLWLLDTRKAISRLQWPYRSSDDQNLFQYWPSSLEIRVTISSTAMSVTKRQTREKHQKPQDPAS